MTSLGAARGVLGSAAVMIQARLGAAAPLVGLLLATLLLIAMLLVVAVPAAHGQSPVPIATPFDPRAEGEGPGLVGEPLLAAAVVVGLGVLAWLLTFLYVRVVKPH